MAHTYSANYVHCVFSTKGRRNLIPLELQEKLWAYLLGIANNLGLKTLAVGGMPNHIHILVGVPTKMLVAEVVQKLKANSSRWMGEHHINFQWQDGYGAFSVSPSLLVTVQAYIRNQEEHHKKRTFEDELRALLDKSGIQYDAENLFAA
ncbi:MAG TPA: IS200/IS605 family transposase [Candidatus Sulfotelmatobacter sp.]|jgi:REP element-mobilizing transposase RayT